MEEEREFTERREMERIITITGRREKKERRTQTKKRKMTSLNDKLPLYTNTILLIEA